MVLVKLNQVSLFHRWLLLLLLNQAERIHCSKRKQRRVGSHVSLIKLLKAFCFDSCLLWLGLRRARNKLVSADKSSKAFNLPLTSPLKVFFSPPFLSDLIQWKQVFPPFVLIREFAGETSLILNSQPKETSEESLCLVEAESISHRNKRSLSVPVLCFSSPWQPQKGENCMLAERYQFGDGTFG